MTALAILLYALAGLLGIAGLTYALRARSRGDSLSIRSGAGLVLAPAAVYALAYLSAIATGTPQTYAQAPGTAWAELLGRVGFWAGVASGVGILISVVVAGRRDTRRNV